MLPPARLQRSEPAKCAYSVFAKGEGSPIFTLFCSLGFHLALNSLGLLSILSFPPDGRSWNLVVFTGRRSSWLYLLVSLEQMAEMDIRLALLCRRLGNLKTEVDALPQESYI